MRRPLRTTFAALTMFLVLSAARPSGWSQLSTTGLGSPSTKSGPLGRGLDDDMDAMHGPRIESLARTQNAERQKRLVGDTERLLTLTNQLKATIANSGSETPTPEMLHQMDEIEKLARSVKNKMRN